MSPPGGLFGGPPSPDPEPPANDVAPEVQEGAVPGEVEPQSTAGPTSAEDSMATEPQGAESVTEGSGTTPGDILHDARRRLPVLALRYRPQTFADLVGQEAIARTLQNAIPEEPYLARIPVRRASGGGKDHHRPDSREGAQLFGW